MTSLSSHELALGYQEDTPDPSVFVKFRVEAARDRASLPEALEAGDTPVYMLAWTTTPWTLPGNTALAVDEDAEYSVVEVEGDLGKERLVLAAELVDANIRQEHTVVGAVEGSALVGLTYTPLYAPDQYGSRVGVLRSEEVVYEDGTGGEFSLQNKVVAADFVSMEDGTGIVHIAPAFGDEDPGTRARKGAEFRAAGGPAGTCDRQLSLCGQVREGRRFRNHG